MSLLLVICLETLSIYFLILTFLRKISNFSGSVKCTASALILTALSSKEKCKRHDFYRKIYIFLTRSSFHNTIILNYIIIVMTSYNYRVIIPTEIYWWHHNSRRFQETPASVVTIYACFSYFAQKCHSKLHFLFLFFEQTSQTSAELERVKMAIDTRHPK